MVAIFTAKAMKKSKDHIKRFLSSLRPASERDEHLIRLFLNKRKIKISSPLRNSDRKNLDGITYEQFEAWYNTVLPAVGDVVKSEKESIYLVVQEKWNTFVVGVTLTKEGDLSFEKHKFADEKWTMASEKDILSLQKMLSVYGVEWNPTSNSFVTRSLPRSPKFVRLMVMGKQTGIGIFKEILPDNTLEMFCVKMEHERIRYSDNLNLGDADYFSFFDTNYNHKAIIQQELGEMGFIWNVKCRRFQKNNARAKIGKSYFWLSAYLDIKQSTESDSVSDRKHFNRGNYFLRRDVAIRARDKIINICKEEMMSDDNV